MAYVIRNKNGIQLTTGSSVSDILYLDDNGDVSIGTSTPKGTGATVPRLTIANGDSGVSATGLPIDTSLIVENDSTSYVGILSPDDSVSGVYFGTPTDSFSAILRWDDFNSRLQLGAQVVISTLEFTVGNKDNPSFTISPQTSTLGDRNADLVGYGSLSIQKPVSDDKMTYDSSTNVLKLESSSIGGGIIVDTSDDPTPATFTDVYRAAYFITEAPNTQYIPTNMSATAQTLTVALVGPGEQTQGNIGPGIAFTYADDASTGGSTAVIRSVKSDTDISGEVEDGSLLVLGTREADNGGGGALVRESLRIGHNQYLGIMYTPDSSTNPTAMLTMGTNVGDDTTIAMRETSATIDAITSYGQWYVKSSDGKPYFKTSAGTEYDLTAGSASISGSGTTNYVARFTPDGTTLGDSSIQDNGSTIGIGALEPNSSLNIEDTLTNGIRVINTKTNGLAKGALFSAQGANTVGINVGISVSAFNSTTENIAGLFAATAGSGSAYALQLSDGTETPTGGKFLKDTGNGKANWADLTEADISDLGTYVTAPGSQFNNQIAVFTVDNVIEGDSNFQWNGTTLTLNGTDAEPLTDWNYSITGTIGSKQIVNLDVTSPTMNGSVEGFVINSGSGNKGQFRGFVANSSNSVTGSLASTGLQATFDGTDGIKYGSRFFFTGSGASAYGIYADIATVTSTKNVGFFCDISGSTGGNYLGQFIDGTEGVGKFIKCVGTNGEANWADLTEADISDLGTYVTSGTGIDTAIAYWDGTDTVTAKTGFTFDDTTDTFNIPQFGAGNFTVGTGIINLTVNSVQSEFLLRSYGASANDEKSIIELTRGRGTSSSASALQSGDTIGEIIFNGTAPNLLNEGSVKLQVNAKENWVNTTNAGSEFVIQTIQNGEFALEDRLRITGNAEIQSLGDTIIGGITTPKGRLEVKVATQDDPALVIDGLNNNTSLLGKNVSTTRQNAVQTSGTNSATIMEIDLAAGDRIVLEGRIVAIEGSPGSGSIGGNFMAVGQAVAGSPLPVSSIIGTPETLVKETATGSPSWDVVAGPGGTIRVRVTGGGNTTTWLCTCTYEIINGTLPA